MAAYGKDDFVTGSDLSDLSDISDEDFNPDDVQNLSDDSEDDDHVYCVCGQSSTLQMIACDNDQCAIVWWHIECAGLHADSLPSENESWICAWCKTSDQTTGKFAERKAFCSRFWSTIV